MVADPLSARKIFLTTVAAVAADDVWAVGAPSHGDPLFERWNGAGWQIVSSARLPGGGEHLDALAAVSDQNVWAVGSRPWKTLIEHWDGKRWRVVPSPNPDDELNELNSITAVSPTNIWAVGNRGGGSNPHRPLIEHWNGKRWSVIASPDVPAGLNSVAAVSGKDIWAVGGIAVDDPGTGVGDDSSRLILHWDGRQWRVALDPRPRAYSVLNAVAASSPNDVWAGGNAGNHPQSITHWNGTYWETSRLTARALSFLDGPARKRHDDFEVAGLAADSPSDVWAVGWIRNSRGTDFILHWDGSAWDLAFSSEKDLSGFSEVAIASPHDVWAVGALIAHASCDN